MASSGRNYYRLTHWRFRAGADEGVRPYTNLLDQRAAIAAVGLFFWRDHYGCGYAVAGFHLQQPYALGVAAGFADCGRVHADDFAVVADQHDLRVFIDLGDGDNFSDALGGLHVNDAFAAAVD